MLAIVASAVLGFLSWSFAEYAIHNWVGHLGKGRNEFSREHLAHHRDGNYFATTAKKAWMALPVVAVLGPLAVLIAGWWLGAAYTAAFLGTYVGYEVLHRRCHTHAPRNPYARWARKHHFHHHFASPKRNHGVSSPLWDLVFRTYDRPGVVKVPAKHAMSWLVDPATGEVYDRYAGDYVITRPKRQVLTRAA